jgi:regulator of RNase E activity RraA
MVEFGGPVNVHGMAVKSGELIHADRHGAIVVPSDKIEEMMKAMEVLTEKEAKIIQAARDPDMTLEKLKAAMRG